MDRSSREILLVQVRLIQANTYLGVCATLLAATILGYLEWEHLSHPVVVGWWAYIGVASAARYATAYRFRIASPALSDGSRWAVRFAIWSGLTGAGWGAAGILLYPDRNLTGEVFLLFVLSGLMLGGSSLLAPRPEAFLAFLVPCGIGPVIRLALEADQTHDAMAALGFIFTVAVLITTYRVHLTLDSSLWLQFENRDLVEAFER